MPRTKEQFETMRNETREKIQTAAMELFVQRGFGTTNVQEIADKAGISIGLLYRHYKTKDELFHELVKFARTGLVRIIELFESDESPAKLMNQFVHEVYQDMVSGEQLANLMILMSQSFSSRAGADDNQNEAAIINQKLLTATSELIKRGQKCEEFVSGNSYEMAMYFFASIQGLAEMKVRLNNNFVMPSTSILTMFLYGKGD
ncbi:TetR/AcrR family transcriptional regulator [Paenibacillus sp. J5C_2022]|uniref:TetR/AcrR family transcriptional regulator n=1 Tax=Paenibacillus sp. J5C2022 TaxID=2977129 RepID=UPI0021CE4FE7|nr:TetR/AcrR family transcriptional regulator [Paenibacillus sp. J5C2022]MCU6709946.1 TetR/AcrR family transcriptional regulator [Paenibacillus sp. J5C2022]